MTVERAKELLPVFTAYAEGKTIQWKLSDDLKWIDFNQSDFTDQGVKCFLSNTFLWRVKPLPREWWICPVCRQCFKFEPGYCCRGNLQVGIHSDTAFIKVREVVE